MRQEEMQRAFAEHVSDALLIVNEAPAAPAVAASRYRRPRIWPMAPRTSVDVELAAQADRPCECHRMPSKYLECRPCLALGEYTVRAIQRRRAVTR